MTQENKTTSYSKEDLEDISEKGWIEDHPQYCEILDLIEKYGNYTKKELVAASYDESREGDTKQVLNSLSRGELMVNLIDSHFGATCQ